MSADRDPEGPAPTLNDEQFALWASAPDAARKAAEAVIAEMGGAVSIAALLPIATRGTLEAAACFERASGVEFHQWAFYFAAHRIWEHLREAHRPDRAVLARVRSSAFRFMEHHRRQLDPWKDTRETSRSTIATFSDALLFAAAQQMGASTAALRGEEDFVELEDARRTGEAVRRVVNDLHPEQIQLLERCAAYGEPAKKFARESGRGYRTLLEELHAVEALCGARLRGLGIVAPRWIPHVSGQVFGGRAANDDDDDPQR